MRAVENDFDGTRMTIPRARDSTGQGKQGVFIRARVRERSDEGVASCGGDVRRTHQVYCASASRWCKCRTLIGQCNYVELIDTIFTDVEGVD